MECYRTPTGQTAFQNDTPVNDRGEYYYISSCLLPPGYLAAMIGRVPYCPHGRVSRVACDECMAMRPGWYDAEKAADARAEDAALARIESSACDQ